MWKQLILYWACFFSLFSSKVSGAFEWKNYDSNHGSFNYGIGGISSSLHPSFDGWLYGFAYKTTSDNSIKQDENNVYVGKLEAGNVYIAVCYAVNISAENLDSRNYYLKYYTGGKYNGWYIYSEPKVETTGSQDFISNISSSDLSRWDIAGLTFDSSEYNGSVPINPGAGLNIFDYSYSLPRSSYKDKNQSGYYRNLFSSASVLGYNTGFQVVPQMVDLPANVSGGRYCENFRIFSTNDFSSFLVEQLRRLSSSYDSDGGGVPDFQEWDGSGSSLVYFWDDPEDDSQYIPGVQRVEVVGGQDVGSLDPPYFDAPPSFNMRQSFGLGPENSSWTAKIRNMSWSLREKLQPLRGRFSPLFEDLEEVSPVHRVQFDSNNKIGFLSSIPIDLTFDFSGASLGSSVVSALSILRAVLVVLIYAVLIWVIFCDITKRESSKDD